MVAAASLVGAVLAGTGVTAASTPLHFTNDTLIARASWQQSQAYTPSQLATAYNYAPLYAGNITSAGQTVALIETGTINPSDLARFDSAMNLPVPKLSQTTAGGARFKVKYDPEATMDVEYLHALAPGAAIRIYDINNNASVKTGWKQMGQALRQAANDGAGTVSISLGACSPTSGYKATSKALAAIVKKGVSVFVSSGDTGDRAGTISQCGRALGVGYPASDPSAVAVGGTTLDLNADNTIAAETAWSGSGGGFDATLLRPIWQKASTLPAGTQRWVPDVSFLADPDTGVQVLYRGQWQQVGGTSLGAPCWAAAWALIRQDAQNAGVTAPTAEQVVYQIGNSADYSSVLHDIIAGSNGAYSAGPGWDAVTGWGTPDVANLAAAVLAGE